MTLAATRRYTTIAMALHWLVAALVFWNIYVGLAAVAKGDSPSARPLVDLHKSIGLTILGLVVLRLLWRIARTPPPLPADYAPWEHRAAHAAHWALYALMLLIPLTGYIHDSAFKDAAAHPIRLFGLMHVPRIAFIQALAPAPKEAVHAAFAAVHLYLGWLLYGLLALHLLAVVKHQAIDREPELQRMLPGGARRPAP